jgi:GNAT superfamily N-acetyltransferase
MVPAPIARLNLRHTGGVAPPDSPRSGSAPDLDVRRADESDLPAILELAQASLGWNPGGPNGAFFRWKHLDNPAGASPMWVASIRGQVVGLRTFLRWNFRRTDGSIARAVRAVDTATHPDHQGRGIFSRLTSGALDELGDDGVDFVFNTPNAQSRPGYVRMGWNVVGRVPISVRPRDVTALARIARSRTAAEKWSQPTSVGDAAVDVLADEGLDRLLESVRPPTPADSARGLSTDRTADHLRWRYRFEPLAYRALVADGGPTDGLIVFRVRGRGIATELVITEVLVPPGDPSTARRLIAEVAHATRADYLIAAGASLPGLVPLPRQGPVLTWRGIAGREEMPPLADWHLTMGDVELF